MVVDSVGTMKTEIRRRREELGWSRQKLALKAGVGLNTVYLLETSQNDVYLDTLVKVLSALGMKLEAAASTEQPKRAIWRYG